MINHSRYVNTLCCLGLCLLLASAVAGAADNAVLSLDAAVQMGLESNLRVRRATMALEAAVINLDRARINHGISVSSLELTRAERDFEEKSAELTLARAEAALEIETAYYGVLRARDTLMLRREAMDKAVRQLDVIRSQHGLGQVAESMAKRSELALRQAEVDLIRAQADLDVARIRLNRLLGQPANSPLVLSPDIRVVMIDVDVQEALQTALQRRVEVRLAENRLLQAEEDVRLADNDYTSETELRLAEMNREVARLQLADVKAAVEMDVRRAAADLKAATVLMDVAAEACLLAQEEARAVELRYDTGMATALEVMEAESALTQARVDAVSAKYEYNLAKARYLKAIGKALEQWTNGEGDTG